MSLYINWQKYLAFVVNIMQDPGTKPVERHWPSIDLGTEIYISDVGQVAEWTVSNFDIIMPNHA